MGSPAATAQSPPAQSAVEAELDRIDRDGPEPVATEDLHRDLLWFATVQRGLEAMSARWLAELDRRQDPLLDPLPELLHQTLHRTPGAAYAQLRTARLLEHFPQTARAWRQGKVSAPQVGVIRQALEQVPKTRLDPAQVEAELLGAARQMDPKELLRHWQQLRYRRDQEAAVEAEAEAQRRRWLNLQETWSGGCRIEGELDPEGGSALRSVLSGLIGPPAPDDHRLASERRADALAELALDRLSQGDLPERGGEKPHLTLIAQLATLRLEPGSPLAELDWGPLVTGQTARRIACDAAIRPLLVDAEGQVLHVGRRRRAIPTRVRQALNLRDGRCQWAGCRMPPERCQPHHRRHWIEGGPDSLDNLRLYCPRHHRLLHPENRRFHSRAPA